MHKPSFHKTPLATGVALALGAAVTSPVLAQEGADDEVIEEIVTTGIRSSLMTSMNRKRNSTGVVDAITAEEIGKFPDQNLAEARHGAGVQPGYAERALDADAGQPLV